MKLRSRDGAGAQGWRCHSVIKADVPGRVLGRTEGLLIVLAQPCQ